MQIGSHTENKEDVGYHQVLKGILEVEEYKEQMRLFRKRRINLFSNQYALPLPGGGVDRKKAPDAKRVRA